MSDESEYEFATPPAVGQGWIVTFSDLIALLLAFFVMLYSVSAREASKVDAAVSSVTEEFARSSIVSDTGTVASKTGIVITDQDYLDAVVTTFRGRDNFGDVRQLRSNDGTLMLRLTRDQVFLPKTGVLRPEGAALIEDIAAAMLRRSPGINLRSIEVRISASPEEIAADTSSSGEEVSVPVRQASRFARTLMEENIPAPAISTVLLAGNNPSIDLAFYTISPASSAVSLKGGAL